jgi:hypothetical protein
MLAVREIQHIPLEVLEMITTHLDFESSDSLRYSFRSLLPVFKPTLFCQYQSLEHHERTHLRVYSMKQDILIEMIKKKDILNLNRLQEKTYLMHVDDLSIPIDMLTDWEICLLEKLRLMLLKLHQLHLLSDIQSMRLFGLLEDPLFFSLIKTVAPTEELIQFYCHRNCVNAMKNVQQYYQIAPNILDYPTLFNIIKSCLEKNNLELYGILITYVGPAEEGSEYENNLSGYVDVIVQSIVSRHPDILKRLLKDERSSRRRYWSGSNVKSRYQEALLIVAKVNYLWVDTTHIKALIDCSCDELLDSIFSNRAYDDDYHMCDILDYLTREKDYVPAIDSIFRNNTHRPKNLSPFWFNAIKNRFFETVKYLFCEKKIEMNEFIVDAVMESKSERIVQLLIEADAVITNNTLKRIIQHGYFYSLNSLIQTEKVTIHPDLLFIAIENGNPKVVNLLLNHTVVEYRHFVECLVRGCEETLKLFLSHNSFNGPIGFTDHQRSQIFKKVVKGSTTTVLSILLQDGRFDPNWDHGESLYVAVLDGRTDMALMLVRDGRADPSFKENEIFLIAVDRKEEILFHLLLRDARVDPLDENRKAVTSATRQGCMEYLKTFEVTHQ